MLLANTPLYAHQISAWFKVIPKERPSRALIAFLTKRSHKLKTPYAAKMCFKQ